MFTYSLLGRNKRRRGSEVNWVIAVSVLNRERGKSGLQRAGYSVTRSEGDLKESAAEKTQPTRDEGATFPSAAKVKW